VKSNVSGLSQTSGSQHLATTCWVLTDPFQKLFSRAELGAAAIFVDHGDVLASVGSVSRADTSSAVA
jgi:transcriptional regulator GlxA family with amidase domain